MFGGARLSENEGFVAVGLGVVGGGIGLVLYSTCTVTFGSFCMGYGYRDIGLIAMIFSGVLFVVGIVLIAISDRPRPVMPSAYGNAPRWASGDAAYHPYGDFDPRGSFPMPAVGSPSPDELFCPMCGTRYHPSAARFCIRDGTELRALR
jgi:hypothetical protein